MNEITSFPQLLYRSMQQANKAWPRLILVLAIIVFFLIAYSAILFLLLFWVQGALLRGMPLNLEHALEGLIVVIALYAALRCNGAIAYAFAFSTTDNFAVTSPWSLAKDSWNNGIGFFVNAFNAGLLIIFGQTLAICPCFLLQSNFIFTPYLYTYEGLKNTAARKRARELTSGFGWVILQRSAVFLLIGYIVVALVFAAILAPHPIVFITLVCIIALYASGIQSQFLHEVYLESKHHHAAAHDEPPRKMWILSAAIVAAIAIIVYYGIKFGLHLVNLRH